MSEYFDKINQLLGKIRVNAVLLVDAFGWLDTSLCKSDVSLKKQFIKS